MKKFLVLLFMLSLAVPTFANNRYKGYYFSNIMTDVYKRGGVTFERHKDSPNVLTVKNNNLNFQAGARRACQDIGMRLPNKEEAPIVFDYLKNSLGYKQHLEFWLNDDGANISVRSGNAAKGFTYTPQYSKDYTYVLWYYGGAQNISYDIDTHRKDSNSPYNVAAICIQEAPSITDNDRIKIIQDDYKVYNSPSGGSFYGVVKKQYDEFPLGIYYKTNRQYLAIILSNLEKISTSTEINNLKDYNIIIEEKDNNKLSNETKKLIEAYNQILIYDDKQ